MDKNTNDTVYFLSKLSIEEEYDIVHSSNKEQENRLSPKLNKKFKVTGDPFYQIDPMLYESRNIEIRKIGTNDRDILSLISALIFMPPFHNLLYNFKEQELERFYETELIRKVFYVCEYFQGVLSDVPFQKYPALNLFMNSDFSDIHRLYDELLKEMHEELVKNYFFTENVWKDASMKQAKINKLYDEYSPIVDLFHLKIKKYLTSKNKTNEFDFVNSIEIDFKRSSFEKVTAQFDSFEGKFGVIKHPHILAFKITNGEDFLMPSRIKIKSREYGLYSFVGKINEESFALIHRDRWYKLSCKTEQVELDKVEGVPWMCFYLATDYDFEF